MLDRPSLSPPSPRRIGDEVERLEAFLNAYWLRPENALWMTLRSLALSRVRWRAPAADVSCGDGIFSFLHHGGRLHESFDVFTAVGNLDRVTDDHADMFDHAPETYAPPIIRRPDHTIAVGTDVKPSMLSKAAALALYDQLIRHDSNQPFPLADAELSCVYCNSAYWVERIDGFLSQLRRVTRPDGAIILHVKLSDMRRYSLERFRDRLGDRFLSIIGRGRTQCWPTLCARPEWERRFKAAGLTIRRAEPFVTRSHALIWDVGLRPIAPLLVRMANGLTPATRLAVKRDWVALLLDLLSPMCRPDFDLSSRRDEPAEIQYVLTPRP